MSSRRAFLAALGSGIGVATTGCTANSSQNTVQSVCSAGFGGSENTVLTLTPNVRAYSGTDGPPVVELVIPVRRSVARDRGLDLLSIDTGGGVTYRIPVDPRNDDTLGDVQQYDYDDVVEYSQSLGHLPQAGRFQLAALDETGQQLDSVRMDFRCYRPARTPNG